MGEGQIKLRNTFQRLRLKEFLSGDFGLSSFRQPEISAWAEISPVENSAFSIDSIGPWGGGGGGERRTKFE